MNPITTPYYNSKEYDETAAIPFIGTPAGIGRMAMGLIKIAYNTGSYALKNVTNQPCSLEEEATRDGFRMITRGATETLPFIGSVPYKFDVKLYKIPGTDDEYQVSNTDLTYKGPIYRGLPLGKGILSHSNGDKYEGMISSIYKNYDSDLPYSNALDPEFSNFGPHGFGVLTLTIGLKYEGNFQYGWFSGKGKYVTTRYIYEGNFSNDEFHGEGTITYFTDKTKWSGNWSNGSRMGEGVLTLSDGSIQRGVWNDNRPVGVHTFIDPKGNETKKIMTNHGVFISLPEPEAARDTNDPYPLDSRAESPDQTTPS